MTNCLRVSMASCSIPSFPSSSTSVGRRTLRPPHCSMNPMPPFNPKDPFLRKLSEVAAKSPETILNRPVVPGTPPYLDLFDSPQLMAYPAQVERSVADREKRPRSPPPDLPSILLNGRIVFIGMPLVSAVTELVIAQLMYLQWADPTQPVYLYINSTGTTRDDGEPVGMEYEGFAIYDAMMMMKCEVHTVCVGAAIGQACLLLAAGTKGRRYMLPNAKAKLQQPRIPPSGLQQASDVLIRTREVIKNKDTLVELLAKHTGNPVEVVAKKMSRSFYMTAVKAKEFGVIDKILRRGQEKVMADKSKSADVTSLDR